MGRMKDVHIETHELVENVLMVADNADEFDEVLSIIGNYLAKQGWQSPTESLARARGVRQTIIKTWAQVIELGGTHDEAGVELAQGLLDLVKLLGFSQRELMGVAQDLVDKRKIVAKSEEPDLIHRLVNA